MQPSPRAIQSGRFDAAGAARNTASPARLTLVGFGLVILLVVAVGCRSMPLEQPLRRFEFKSAHMGTLFTITLYASNAPTASEAAQAAFRRIAALEDVMSDYQADSELMLLCDKPSGTPVAISADLFDVLARGQRIAFQTAGAFDVTVGPYVRLWRFARKRKVLPAESELAKARAAVGYQKLRLDAEHRSATLTVPNMRLDVGGIAKGYAADEALRVLRGRGITSALVAASGDLAIGDAPPGQKGWRVGVSRIDARTNDLAETVLLSNCGISTSGDSEQFITIEGVRYSHIIDPRVGLGLTNRIQATVVASHATTTDALATSVCILGPERGMALVQSLPGVSALILSPESARNPVLASPGFKRLPRVR